MAGPSVVVRVLGDLKGLSGAVEQAASKGGAAAGKLKGAFTGALGALNQTGVLGPFSDALAGLDTALGQIGEHGKQTGAVMMGVGATMAGVGVGLSALGSKEKASHEQLKQSVEATGKSYDDYSKRIEEAAKHNERFGYTTHQTDDALRILTQATGDPKKALDLMGTAADLAAAKHEDLGTAATQLGRASNGAGKIFKEFGITLDTSKGKAEGGRVAIGQLAEKLHGQAAASADTFNGKLKAVGATVEDAAAKFGEKFGPALTIGGTAMAGLGGAITGTQAILGLFRTSQVAATATTEGLTVAEDAAAVSSWAMLGPILLVIGAIAALVAIGYVIYRNWDTIWSGMQAAVAAVWNWIKHNWPLLLGILLGPIGVVAVLIARNWDKIKAGAQAVFDWIKHNWPLLLAILTGPVGAAVLLIVRNWDKVKAGAQAVWNWIRGAWDDIYGWLTAPIARAVDNIKRVFGGMVNWFAGLPGRLRGIFSGAWNGLSDAFWSAMHSIAHAWSLLHFTVPKVDLGPLGSFGGWSVGVPSIPGLAAGGLITKTGLIYAHAGEAITPAPGGTSPSVWIENLTVRETLDVDSFMRRAAWQVQRERI